MKNKVSRLFWAGMLSALMLAGCSRRDEATVGTPENPLVVILSPAHAPSVPGALDFVRNRLENISGLTVTLKVAETPAEAVEAFSDNGTDSGLLTLEEYLVAREEYGVRPELQALRGDRLGDYEGVILARSAADVASLSGKKVGFVGPYSVSGFTLPSIYLRKAGVKVMREFSSSHDVNVRRLLDGEMDAVATYARQAARFPGLKVVAVTGKAPNEPLVTRGGLAEDKRRALSRAFMELASDTDGKKALGAMADITGFRRVNPGVYKPLHDLLLMEGSSIYDLVPAGWQIHKLRDPYLPD